MSNWLRESQSHDPSRRSVNCRLKRWRAPCSKHRTSVRRWSEFFFDFTSDILWYLWRKPHWCFFFTLMWLCQKWLHEGSSMFFFFNVLAFSTIDGNVQEENANQTGGMGSCPMMARFFSHRRNGQRVHQVSKVLSHRFSRRFIRIQQEISWT